MTEIEFIYTSVKHRNITHLQGGLKPHFYDYLSDAASPRFRELSGKATSMCIWFSPHANK